MPKVTVCDLIITEREVLIPDTCPNCKTDLIENGYVEVMFHDEMQFVELDDEGNEVDRQGEADFGETFVTIGWQCKECRTPLVLGREVHTTMHEDRLLELFPPLKDFDAETGEKCFYIETLRALTHLLPPAIRNEPLIIGTYMMQIMMNPMGAGKILMEAATKGAEIIANHSRVQSAHNQLQIEQIRLDTRKLGGQLSAVEGELDKMRKR